MPTSPLVVSPQTKNVPNSSQNTGLRAARASTVNASPIVPACFMGAGAPPGCSPKRSVPMSPGCSGMTSATIGTSSRQAPLTAITTGRHAPPWLNHARNGRKISAPVAVLALSSPITNPCRVANQRFTTAAPSTDATAPLPMPENTPQLSTYCQGWLIHRLAKVDSAISISPASIVRRIPNDTINAAAKGPTSP